jgi:hypothetical protein
MEIFMDFSIRPYIPFVPFEFRMHCVVLSVCNLNDTYCEYESVTALYHKVS